MRLVTLRQAGFETAGIVIGADVLNIAHCRELFPEAGVLPHTVRGLLEGGSEILAVLQRLIDSVQRQHHVDQLKDSGALVNADSARFAAPLPDPRIILAAGMNYRAHLQEMNSPVPHHPYAFFKSTSAIIGPEAPIVLPRTAPDMVDWEGEFCAVIGRTCHNVKARDALDYVAGYTLINDVSARDWAAPFIASTGNTQSVLAWDQNILGKQFPTFCPMGPAVVTSDEITKPDDVELSTMLNGRVMQSANTADLVFSIPELIEYYSRYYTLRTGDVITTGSPSGVGYGRDPKVFMKSGDRIEVQATGIGVLSNPVVAG